MFYQTRIQSVGNGFAVDVHGKSLFFIGVLPVKAGDIVYTDGNVIFGHVQPKGSPAIFDDEPSGIPVLANNLRGYFTMQGSYKNYRIAGDNWITNAQKIYRHDNDNSNIIDADIARDENDNEIGCYTAEKVTQSISAISDDNFSDISFKLQSPDFCAIDNVIKKSCNLIIRKDDAEVTRINLHDFATSIENNIANIMKDFSWDDSTFYHHQQTRINIANFKINPKGKWTALVDVEVICKRFYPESTFVYNRVKTDKKISSESFDLLNLPTIEGWTYWGVLGVGVGYNFVYGLRSLTADRYVIVEGLTAELYYAEKPITIPSDKNYIQTLSLLKVSSNNISEPEVLSTSTYYSPLTRGSYQQFTIDGIEATDYSYDTAGYNVYSPKGKKVGDLKDLLLNNGYIDQREYDSWELGIGDTDYYAVFTSSKNDKIRVFVYFNSTYYGSSFYAAPRNRISIDNKRAQRSEDFTFIYSFIFKKVFDADKFAEPEQSAVSEFAFPVQDDFYSKFSLANNTQYSWWALNGIYDQDNNLVFSGGIFSRNREAYKWNFAVVPFDKGYFVGYYKGLLFKNSDIVGSNLKNFRLRKLNKISVAKK